MARSGVVLTFVVAAAFFAAFVGWLYTRDRDGGRPILFPAPAFRLTTSRGTTLTHLDLRGHVWVVDFAFSRCASICPTLGSRFVELQETLPADFRLVTISVDPEHDTPEVLRKHSEQHYKPQPGRWHWLTGERRTIYALMQEGFKVGEPGAPLAEDNIPHTGHALLIDARGRVRGTYEITDRAKFDDLLRDARELFGRDWPLAKVKRLPAVNAGLNGLTALILLLGYGFIRGRRIRIHKACMISACFTSLLFLLSYLTYHHFHGATPYPGTGMLRIAYFAVLISHTVLAALIVPLVLVTLYNALRDRFDRHRAVARWTFPIWLYVSVTGVVIYVMLYLVPPGS